MPDPTIKVKEETRADLQELQREYGFGTMDELQRHLSVIARAGQTAKNVSELAPAIEAVKELSLRICSILSGAGDTVLTMKEGHQEAIEEQKRSFEKTLELQQARISELERQIAEDSAGELRAEIAQLKLGLEAASQKSAEAGLAHEKAMIELERRLMREHAAETAALIASFKAAAPPAS